MATGQNLRRIALSLKGTEERPHFDRAAFRVARTYATLAADGKSANLMLSLDEQEFRCAERPDAFAPVPGGWGRMGFTTATLAALHEAELAEILRIAWQGAQPRPRPGKKAARKVPAKMATKKAASKPASSKPRR